MLSREIKRKVRALALNAFIIPFYSLFLLVY